MKLSQTAVVVVKDSVRSKEIVAVTGRWLFRAFQFQIELDYYTVRRMLVLLVAKCL